MANLAAIDRELLAGAHGAAAAFAMDLVVRYARAVGAEEFIDVSRAHVDGCLNHGKVSLDFVEHLVRARRRGARADDAECRLDGPHPSRALPRSRRRVGEAGKRLMELHEALGCVATYTCAPYQTIFRPRKGEQIAWAESNAIVFANSVIGARTDRYGDFIDLAAALTGRVPYAGLHKPENRRGRDPVQGRAGSGRPAVERARGRGRRHRRPARRHRRAGDRRPAGDAFRGRPQGARGGRRLDRRGGDVPCRRPDAGGGRSRRRARRRRRRSETIELSRPDLDVALAQLSTADEDAPLTAVSLGTPHFSFAEFEELVRLLDGFKPAAGVDLYVNTSRQTYTRLVETGLIAALKQARFNIVVDTCTYVTAIMRDLTGVVMTNSGKWAHYAPGNLGVDVAFGTLIECLNSAARGRVTRRRP